MRITDHGHIANEFVTSNLREGLVASPTLPNCVFNARLNWLKGVRMDQERYAAQMP